MFFFSLWDLKCFRATRRIYFKILWSYNGMPNFVSKAKTKICIFYLYCLCNEEFQFIQKTSDWMTDMCVTLQSDKGIFGRETWKIYSNDDNFSLKLFGATFQWIMMSRPHTSTQTHVRSLYKTMMMVMSIWIVIKEEHRRWRIAKINQFSNCWDWRAIECALFSIIQMNEREKDAKTKIERERERERKWESERKRERIA